MTTRAIASAINSLEVSGGSGGAPPPSPTQGKVYSTVVVWRRWSMFSSSLRRDRTFTGALEVLIADGVLYVKDGPDETMYGPQNWARADLTEAP